MLLLALLVLLLLVFLLLAVVLGLVLVLLVPLLLLPLLPPLLLLLVVLLPLLLVLMSLLRLLTLVLLRLWLLLASPSVIAFRKKGGASASFFSPSNQKQSSSLPQRAGRRCFPGRREADVVGKDRALCRCVWRLPLY